ncbi:hypothetical protein QZH52_34160 [Variovorax ginsengisoli]|uniref:Uncharacterized protein n=1 Tax=Variovorax ginsengisoli TaxID=363844 RepID=A0ABT8SEY9_9BURK|nr:hypothetical protein [Variovorax ginsengisoli]MDN8618145.1 hypothetical protein [Variovorax ginsengisoli]MDO1537315.1 hypothetical protein [Variovorax ginsengisoli]
MREAWREVMFADTDQLAKATRDPVAPATRSKAALAKAARHTLADGTPVHSFSTLMAELATCGHARGAPGTRCIVQQGLHPAVQEALAPQGHLAPIQIDLGGDVLVLPALSGQQHDLDPLLRASLDAASARQGRQLSLNSGTQFDSWSNAHDDLRRGRGVPHQISSTLSSALH